MFIKKPVESKYLTSTLMYLDDWISVSISGRDTIKYLQSQLTLDLTSINENQHYMAAHCNSFGKMLSNLRLFYFGKTLTYIIRKELLKFQLTELKKYAIFSEIKFSYGDKLLLGFAGYKSEKILKHVFEKVPNHKIPVVQNNDTAILWFKNPIERFLIVTNSNKINVLKKHLMCYQTQFSDNQQWLALDIESGIPIIDIKNSGKFIPQATNLHMLNAISFNKGCYIGQETIARAKYLGINKYRLCWLTGQCKNLPSANDQLEIKANNIWRCTGKVLASVKLDNNLSWIQAVLDKNVHVGNVLRAQQDNTGYLKIKSLPYLLEYTK
ncbi:tRNA-modifying protein YgfZ [Candidatus Pantoea edessiphila]|uniref:tRNA-modifying protein YgfZ n=1 Tax=Candidatus Pantoea edessiphila TaxID=2044610 RepID=A0A2P5SZL3_9GAMM|nr:tRNA-modifying protein YgfZ [Candidatus Pantoea edessiphila]PPI87779.1 tRNA-modifying protein YgfZ [Candidatus Pantoea edessiphila]